MTDKKYSGDDGARSRHPAVARVKAAPLHVERFDVGAAEKAAAARRSHHRKPPVLGVVADQIRGAPEENRDRGRRQEVICVRDGPHVQNILEDRPGRCQLTVV
jgi:hypothetical protein